jgi:uncharacterized membrane protein YiaA
MGVTICAANRLEAVGMLRVPLMNYLLNGMNRLLPRVFFALLFMAVSLFLAAVFWLGVK